MPSKNSDKKKLSAIRRKDFISHDELSCIYVRSEITLFDFFLILKQKFNINFTLKKCFEEIIEDRVFQWPLYGYENETLKIKLWAIPNQSNPLIMESNEADLFGNQTQWIKNEYIIKNKNNGFFIIFDGTFHSEARLFFLDFLKTNHYVYSEENLNPKIAEIVQL
ncbi:MAG: hypothetical protein N3F09_04980 [Bacteroidia bacterium]|nr:hypothetical protein [Bacteroidia bacterium]